MTEMRCDDCDKEAGIAVCTGCWEKAKSKARSEAFEEAARLQESRIPYLRECLATILRSDRESRMDYERRIAAVEESAADFRALSATPATVVCVPVETIYRAYALLSHAAEAHTCTTCRAYRGSEDGRKPHALDCQNVAALAEMAKVKP